MENQNSATKIMLMYGAILAGLSVLINLINYSFGNIYQPHWSIGIVSFILLIGIIVYGIKVFKDGNNGFLTLGQAIKIGLGITLISAIIGIIYQLIFSNVIEPDFYDKMAEYQEQVMLEKFPDMPEEQLEKALEMTQKFSSPGMMAAFALGGSLLFGLIISLIAGLILKKEETAF
jgi:hypothetical protein